MPAKARNYAIALALVLHFQHHALIRFVCSRDWLGDYAVKTRTLETTKPICRDIDITGGWRQVDWWNGGREQRFKDATTFLKGQASQVSIALGEQIEED